MSKNFDELPAASALGGTETTAVNQGGVSKKTTIDAIKTFISSAFEAAGAVAVGINAHLAAFAHNDIAHANRTALDAVLGVNTGDQDLSPYLTTALGATKANPTFSGTVNLPASVTYGGTLISTTAAEINIIHGLTATATELNYTDGVTSPIQGQINSKVSAAAPVTSADATINGLTAGRGAGNKLSNVVFGGSAMYSNTTGTGNVAIGSVALGNNIDGYQNTAVGSDCLAQVADGIRNSAFGAQAANYFSAGDGNTFIGAFAGGVSGQADVSNSTAIGAESYTTKSNQVVIGNPSVTEVKLQGNAVATTVEAIKSKMNADGGYMVKLTNKTGAASVKGTVVTVYAATAVDNAVDKIVVDIPTPIGVIYEDGIADGQEVWVVVSGIASVYFIGNTTRGHLARGFVTGDAGYVAGQALSEAVPGAPFATDKHFYEIGHVLASRTGAGLANVMLHFN